MNSKEGWGKLINTLKVPFHFGKKGSKIIGKEIVKKVRNIKEGINVKHLSYKKVEVIKINEGILQLIIISDKRLCALLGNNKLIIYNYNMKKIDININIRSSKVISLPNNRILLETLSNSYLEIYQIDINTFRLSQELKKINSEHSIVQFFSQNNLYINESYSEINSFVSVYKNLNHCYILQTNIYFKIDKILNIIEFEEKNYLAIQQYYSIISFYHLHTFEYISKIDFSYIQNLITENSLGLGLKLSEDKIIIPSFEGYILIGDINYFLPYDTIKVNKSRAICKINKFSDGKFYSIEQYKKEENVGFERPFILQWEYEHDKFDIIGSINFKINHIKPISNFVELYNGNFALTFLGKKKIRIYSLKEK